MLLNICRHHRAVTLATQNPKGQFDWHPSREFLAGLPRSLEPGINLAISNQYRPGFWGPDTSQIPGWDFDRVWRIWAQTRLIRYITAKRPALILHEAKLSSLALYQSTCYELCSLLVSVVVFCLFWTWLSPMLGDSGYAWVLGYLEWRFTILQYADQSLIILLELKLDLDCGTDLLLLWLGPEWDFLKSSKDFQVLLVFVFAEVPNWGLTYQANHGNLGLCALVE